MSRRELQDYNTDTFHTFPYGPEGGEHQEFSRIFDPNLGYKTNEVVGQDAQIRKIELRAMFNYRPWSYRQLTPIYNELQDCYVRLVVYIDKQPDEEVPGELFSEDSYNIIAFKNLEWSQRFQILIDDRVKLCKGNWFPVSVVEGLEAYSSKSSTKAYYNLHGRTDNLEDLSLLPAIRSFPTPRISKGTGDNGEIKGEGKVLQSAPTSFAAEGDITGHVEFTTKEVRGNGLITAPSGVGTWEIGVTPLTCYKNPLFGNDDIHDGKFETTSGSISNLDFETIGQIEKITTVTDDPAVENWEEKNHDITFVNLPEYDISRAESETNYGLHGTIESKTDTQQYIRWTGSSEVKEYYVDTNFIWTKKRTGIPAEDKITRNDIRFAIITAIPREVDINEEVLSIYIATRIRYNKV